MKLELPAVWSKRHTDPLPFPLPGGWQLATHQAEVYAALRDPEVDVVFDTAMTGDGKTLAAHLPLLRPTGALRGQPVFIYPTNELLRDQERQAVALRGVFGPAKFAPQVLDSAAITRHAEEFGAHRYAAVRDLVYGFGQQPHLFSNPDLFTLVNNFAYTLPSDNAATLAALFNNIYRYVVFDEFHTYDAPQVSAVLDAMILGKTLNGDQWPIKYLFLSATPNAALRGQLEEAGFRCRDVGGQYQHGDDPGADYRRILQAATLTVEACNAEDGGIHAWFESHLTRVRAFYAAHPGAKGAVICNSVLAAKRLHAVLSAGLAPAVAVVENTGLTGREARRKAFEQLEGPGSTLLVATSTVDLGVDFRLNYLIFEALDAGSFIQRLGRLGRHPGFETYQATTLLPRFLTENPELVKLDGLTVDRETFFTTLREHVFPRHQEFKPFVPRWGGVNAALRGIRMRRGYPTVLPAYEVMASRVYGLKADHVRRARRLLDPGDRQAAVLQELGAFRGAGILDVWVHDAATDAVASISVLRLLSGAQFQLIPEAEARAVAKRVGATFHAPRLRLYARLTDYREERLPVDLVFGGKLCEPLGGERATARTVNQAADRRGFELNVRSEYQGEINRTLRQLSLCTCVLEPKFNVNSARRCLKLPPLFELYAVHDDLGRGGIYPVAFGRDALLLDSIQHWRTTDDHVIV